MKARRKGRFARRAGSGTASEADLDLVETLECAAAALAAAGVEVWDINRDLAIACNQRAQRCRIKIKELAS